MLVVPSVKYHLPANVDEAWRVEEYLETTRQLVDAYRSAAGEGPMPLEKDFSPTLAGSDRAGQRAVVLEWLSRVPGLIRPAGTTQVKVGLKLFNSLEGDDFQLAMLAAVHGEPRPDFLVYANRLFDPDREFEGQRGVAYGGPDLSDRNLRLLSALRAGQARGDDRSSPAGDQRHRRYQLRADRGRVCAEGLHQLPDPHDVSAPRFRVRHAGGQPGPAGVAPALLRPRDGFILWMIHAARRLGLDQRGGIAFRDLARRGGVSPRPRGPRLPLVVGRRSGRACPRNGGPSARPVWPPRRSRRCRR